jgi:uroporphyrinogen-III synthase
LRHEKPRILLLRPNPPEPAELGEVGIVAAIPLAIIEPNASALAEVERNLTVCDWLVLTSPRAPRILKPIAEKIRELVRRGSLKIAVVGPRTGEALLKELNLKPHVIPREYRGASLAEELGKYNPSCVLAARSERGVKDFTEILKLKGVKVKEVHLYNLKLLDDMASLVPMIADNFDYIVVTSPSIAEAFASHYKGGKARIVAIGPSTAKTLESLGFKDVLVAREYTLKGVAKVIARDWASRTAYRRASQEYSSTTP